MSYIDKYRKRLQRKGDNVGEVFANNTTAFIEKTFESSPTFKRIQVVSSEVPEITEIDARVGEVERMGALREVLFRPHQGLPIGSYVKFDGQTWIVTDLWFNYGYQTKALVQKCNNKLRWAIDTEWLDEDGNLDHTKIKEFDCVISYSQLGSKSNQGKIDIEWNKYDVRLPQGQLFAFVEKNEFTSKIDLNTRFIFSDNSVYEVYGMDDISLVTDGKGIIQLTVKLTTKQEKDDIENRIAFNDYKKSLQDKDDIENRIAFNDYKKSLQDDEVNGINQEKEEEKGGRIW